MLNESKCLNSGARLWDEAKEYIPGGNQLLSKRSEMFLPDHWPSYYKRAKGASIWDLDDVHYYDMSIMGMGTCPLGYAHDDVNSQVKQAIDDSSISTLNCPEEVELAKALIDLHPWADMARFTRSGGEACCAAVRIARAFTKRDKVAFCGYHGWHDWYLSSNLANEHNLDAQLLSGLKPSGVPKNLGGTSIPFHYGNIDELKQIVDDNPSELAAIIMEVQRYQDIDIDFLNKVRSIADDIGAVLIFDEVTSGFRLNAGGMHLLHDINPDIVVLGKAMGNGYPISAVVGRQDVMQAAQNTFISSTMWTERVGFVASLAVIDQFKNNNIAETLVQKGQTIKEGLKKLITKHNINIDVCGIDSIIILAIKDEKASLIKTVFTQEMLKRGFLAANVIYVSIAHTDEIIHGYLEAVDEVFAFIQQEYSKGTLEEVLQGPECHSGFKRLN